jgi:hypothetical protein
MQETIKAKESMIDCLKKMVHQVESHNIMLETKTILLSGFYRNYTRMGANRGYENLVDEDEIYYLGESI